jgi:hypothetical protein
MLFVGKSDLVEEKAVEVFTTKGFICPLLSLCKNFKSFQGKNNAVISIFLSLVSTIDQFVVNPPFKDSFPSENKTLP